MHYDVSSSLYKMNQLTSSLPFEDKVDASTISKIEDGQTKVYLHNYTSYYQMFIYSNTWEDILIASIYGALFLLGLIGNVSVVITIFKKGPGRQQHRNFINLSLTTADLLITILCYPSNLLPIIIPNLKLRFPLCNIMIAVQVALHAASTFSMAFLSIDRFMTIKKPKTATKVARWIPLIVCILWLLSISIAVPSGFLPNFKRSKVNCKITHHREEKSIGIIYIIYFSLLALVVYILPCILVILCHFFVAISLKQRNIEENKFKPKQVIIVARNCLLDGNAAHKIVDATSSNDSYQEEKYLPAISSKQETVEKRLKHSKLFSPKPAVPVQLFPSRNIKTIIRAHRRLRLRQKAQHSPTIFSDPRSHSTETRLRLAKVLMMLAVTFSICWLPYSVILITWSLIDGKVINLILQFSLLLGHAHSAFSPIIYGLLNRSALTSVQRAVSSYIHWPTNTQPLCCGIFPRPRCLRPSDPTWGNNSSTNEAALGPFHPKYVNPLALRPLPSRCTSHYFH